MISIIWLVLGCQVEDGSNGYNSLLATEIEMPGANCEAGGVKIKSGVDTNRNDILENSEIQEVNFICNGQSGELYMDNLVRLNLGSPDFVGCGTQWTNTEFESWQLHDFNKLDYENVTSILFVPSLSNEHADNILFAELFNVTDNVPIANSQVSITSNEGLFKFKYSDNIYDALPNYPITLTIRLRNLTETCGTTGTYSYLYILRE